MVLVNGLIWDDWNKNHIADHKITIEEVEEVCHGNHRMRESYRKRILITGRTKTKRFLAIVLSPENRNLKLYGNGIYYVVTAFEKEVKL
ncbi:hypothetical protein HY030_02035 [Candidatus Gottesmanbacteria bacterium]|nr:hypothetical protein [Candidatus Gottesmanbacteria bacterium]